MEKITIECEKKKDMEVIFTDVAKIIKKLSNERKLEGAIQYG